MKTALITGGARRIGAAIVRILHQNGYNVVIHCRNALKEAQALAWQLNQIRINTALVVTKELTAIHAAEDLMAVITNWTGRLDLLVNNASIFIASKLDIQSFDIDSWQAQFDIHVKIPFLMSLAAHPLLKTTQGSIINITDIHASRSLKGYSVYCQTKAALNMQTLSLACEFAPEVRVNAVAPGAILWPENDNELTIETKNEIIAKTPLKQHGKPEFIAHAVLSLAQNAFITGQIITVDGGRSL